MQVVLHLPSPFVSTLAPKNISALSRSSFPKLQTCKISSIKASAVPSYDPSTVDYSSGTSLWRDACAVEMYPEVKPESEARTTVSNITSELYDREYLEYDGPKTVFLEEACDDLGGEFCHPEYQSGAQ
ncbi:hypothetical protein K2173_006885 [Erythroxylum novogranatense]|uniref:Uncharacterized protein n=1 Tax=Erythroxylum novogranatense TaxID=1862640 RepID=A0AAV8SZ94_9ROSI|nr:hypothetical protein K2173_006885 [Erythroxylum novogranatense]